MPAQLRAEASQPYRMKLVGGVHETDRWLAGISIDLDDGWKTYWRMPGEAGIPPQFDWTASRGINSADVLYPLPQRLHDLSGETVGYERQVIFPLIVRPTPGAAEANLHLDLFFAVCKDVCIPAKAQGTLALGNANSGDAVIIDKWMKRIPVPGTVVRSATAILDATKIVLVAKLLRPVDDIFVESASPAYFRKPAFSADGLEARLTVDNVKDVAELIGLSLNLTIATAGSGIEQTVTVE